MNPTQKKYSLIAGIAGLLIIVIALLLVFISFKAFLWYVVIVSLTIYIAECWRVKGLLLPKRKVKPISTTTDHLPAEQENLIQSITELILKDFVTCIVDKNYSCLGTGTPSEITTAWGRIISQYQAIRKDPAFYKDLLLSKKIYEYEIRTGFITLNSAILKHGYSRSAIKALKTLYPQFQFIKESLEKDLKNIAIGEIFHKGNYDKAIKLLEENQSQEHKTATRQDFYTSLIEINKLEGTKYDMNITVMEFAILENRLHEHYEFLKDQNRKNGR